MSRPPLPAYKKVLGAIVLLASVAAGGLFLMQRSASEALAQGARTEAGNTPGMRHILVDQFGYRPEDPKVAVIRSPVEGHDKADGYAPGTLYQVRRLDTGEVVHTGAPEPWNRGQVQASSGDRGWWFDFSNVRTPGRYEVVDAQRDARSTPFEIAPDVYRKVLREATRTYFYQRSSFAKREPYAQACWADEAAYLGSDQDAQAHDVNDRNNDAKVRDMRGGWFDAGDTNKYVTFAATAVHQLLQAYENSPATFTDDFGIPESGNGIPDLLDEIRWETDWVKRMQFDHGGLALKVGAIKIPRVGAPSQDRSPRFYVPECTSATIAGAGIMAHAAHVFRKHPSLQTEAADLQQRARSAWTRYVTAPRLQTDCDNGTVRAGDADRTEEEQKALAAQAAIYLFALTGEPAYRTYVLDHHRDLQPYRDMGWGRYNEDQGEALLLFAQLESIPSGFRQQVLSDFRREVAAGNGVFGFEPKQDLYRSFLHDPQYHWGSLQPRANYGNVNLQAARHGMANAAGTPRLRQRALETLHYFHGVNPQGMVMLTNMRQAGATRSLDRLFHVWFSAGTKWDSVAGSACGPAPGFVTGGANAYAEENGVPASVSPPSRQPPQKAFLVSNDTRVAAWTFNENGIYYQSSYVKLLSEFVR